MYRGGSKEKIFGVNARLIQIEAPKASSGVGYGEGVPSQPTKKSGERRELPAGTGAEPHPKKHFGVF